MTIPELQIGAFGCRFVKKNSPYDHLWTRVAKFHQIDAPNIMVRSSLALDTPNDCDTPDLGQGAKARRWSRMAM